MSWWEWKREDYWNALLGLAVVGAAVSVRWALLWLLG